WSTNLRRPPRRCARPSPPASRRCWPNPISSTACRDCLPIPTGPTSSPRGCNALRHSAEPSGNTTSMFENAFNNIDRAMRNDEGLASELDYAEQTSWLLFLKYLDDMEHEWADEAALEGRDYTPLL